MARTYRRKPSTRRGRQLIAVELRGKGMSLREIAKVLGCSHLTVKRDLEAAAQTVTFPVTKLTPRGEECNTECNGSEVVSLSAERFARRQA